MLERYSAFGYAVIMDGKEKELGLDEDQGDTVAPSVTAKEVKSLRDTVLKFAANRERLPQPLFWSLFNARIADIKKNKERSRVLEELLNK